MKTTLEIPDDLFRKTKSTAALRGESLKDFVTDALEAHVERRTTGGTSRPGWRSVFGQARKKEVEAIDAKIAAEFERVDPADWR